MNYREGLQQTLRDNEENYILKTNAELIDMITYFGSSETEFHTADIERLIVEHEEMYNGSYMKRGFARIFQVGTNLSSHVLYTVLYAFIINF